MEHDTSRPAGAREHARSMAGRVVRSMPTVPVSAARDLPPGADAERLLWDETLGQGAYAARRLPRGARLRLTNLDGDACAGLIAFNARETAERLSVADTVKVQWNAYLGAKSLLLSDMGRSLLAILEDGCGHHDAFCGTSRTAAGAIGRAASADPGPLASGRDGFLVALAKLGLGRRDLGPNVSFFQGVTVDDQGGLRLPAREPAPGEHVLLRADMPVIVAIVNVPHVLDEAPATRAGRLRLTAWRGAPAAADDPIRRSTPERMRAYQNVDDWLLGAGEDPR